MKRSIIMITLLMGLSLGPIMITTHTAARSAPGSANSYSMRQTTPTLAINDASLVEGNTGTSLMVFTVTLTATGTRPAVSVRYTTANGLPPSGATAPPDYASATGPLIFPAGTGNATMTISVTIIGDSVAEPDETFFVNLSNADGATITDGQGVGTILNDDDVSSQLTLSSGNVTVTEGNPGAGPVNAVFTISLSAAPSSTVTVDYATADGTATVEDQDYTASSGTVIFPAGDATPKTVSILIHSDDKPESAENFFFNLSNAHGATITFGHAECLIINDDGADPCVYEFDAAPRNHPVDGGTGTIAIRAPEGCRWAAFLHPDGDFLVFTSPTNPDGSVTGSGDGAVSYSIANNPGFERRGGRIEIWSDNARPQLLNEIFIIQAGRERPPCSVLISPANATARSDGGMGTITVTAPSDCQWSAKTDATWILIDNGTGQGNGVISYQVNSNTIPDRTGTILVNDQTHIIYQYSVNCPLELMCNLFPSGCGHAVPHTLSQARSFRDKILGASSRGKRYTELYYRFSTEAVQIMMLNPMLILRSQEMMERYLPVIESMVRSEPVTLSRSDLDEIESFINSFAVKGGTELREAIKDLCRDLRDPLVHKEFSISISDSPKREISANSPFHLLMRTGALLAPVGLFLLCCYRNPAGRKRIKTALKRLGCLAMVLSIGYGVSLVNDVRAGISTLHNFSAKLNQDQVARAGLTYNRLPLNFEANYGQADPEVKYISRAGNFSLLLAPTQVEMRIKNRNAEVRSQDHNTPGPLADHRPPASDYRLPAPGVLRMTMIGAAPHPRLSGLDETAGRVNYFRGTDPAKWQAGVPTYTKVKYENLYKGVDLIFYGNQQQLEYDFCLAPGADPATIRLGIEGASAVEIDQQGDLVLSVAGGEIRQRRPVAYQQINGTCHEIACRYTLHAQIVGIEPDPYDHNKPLVIDPVLAYSTYFGGSGNEEGNSIAVDSAGNAYITGFTDSINFPLANSAQANLGGGLQDAFVVKLDPSGNQVLYSTYIGGNGQDNGTSIAVDLAGNAYITGFTDSTNFPVRNPLQATKKGNFNAFVVRLDPRGSLLNSTLFGGSQSDFGSSITVDSAGNVYVAGIASSANLPTVNAIQPAPKDLMDLFVAKIDPSANRLVYSTYLGGQGFEGASSIAVDAAGSVYLTGLTSSNNFPTINPLQPAHGGGVFDAFVTKLNPAGTAVIYSTYLGGSGADRAFRIAVDAAGNAYVTGDTASTNFPLANAVQPSGRGSSDAFAAKLNPSGTQLLYSTYLGGSGIDGGTAIAVDSAGSAYVAGFTASTNFPTVNPVQPAFGGNYDGFIAKLSPAGSTLDYSTYLGGTGIDAAFGIAANATGAYVMGVTNSTNFPTANPIQSAFGGGTGDIFVARIRPTPTINNARVKGKKLLIEGSGFDQGATILVDGQPQKSANDEQNPTTSLIGKKAGKKIAHGQAVTLQVRNSDGSLSNAFSFKRSE